MTPINHTDCHRDLAKPSNWDSAQFGECVTLPIAEKEFNNLTFRCSFWRPDEDELKAINEGKSIMLCIHSRQHPVVIMMVEQ